ncbi:MAG: SDR family NAD(P)-dependent oxidoreductase [Eubacteriales bacterium]
MRSSCSPAAAATEAGADQGTAERDSDKRRPRGRRFCAPCGDVRRAAEEINARYDMIDILINSAGIHSTKRLLSEDGNELVFQVNHLAPFLLPAAALDCVKTERTGQNHSSLTRKGIVSAG